MDKVKNCLSSKYLVLTVLIVVLTGFASANVDDSDMCFFQPFDQCNGVNFEEYGAGLSTFFELDVSGATSGGTLYLERKSNDVTSFSDVYNTNYNSLYGGNQNIFFNSDGTSAVAEDGSQTITIGSTEHTLEVTDIDFANKEVEYTLDGSPKGYHPVGHSFLYDGRYWQITDVTQSDRTEQLNEGDSLTFDDDSGTSTLNVVSINDGNIEYNIDGGSNDFASDGETIFHDGAEIVVEDVFFFGTDDPNNAVDLRVVGGGGEDADFTLFNEISPGTDQWEYRARWEGSDGSSAWSDSIVFTVDSLGNLPLDKKVVVDGQTVNQPRTLSGVTQDSDITLTLEQEEQDPVNITLVDASDGTRVSTVSGCEDPSECTSYGGVRQVYDDISDAVLATFTDTGTANEFTFPTGSSDLLSQQSSTHSFYFEIKDLADSNTIRKTKVYTVETDTSTNQPPNVTNIEANVEGTGWIPINSTSFGDNITQVRADITDDDNRYISADLAVENLYDDETLYPGFLNRTYYVEKNGDTYIWNMSNLGVSPLTVEDSGGWKASIKAVDQANNTGWGNSTWSYPFSRPEISIETVSLVQKNTFFNTPPKITVSCPQYECINENESINTYLDPKPSTGLQTGFFN